MVHLVPKNGRLYPFCTLFRRPSKCRRRAISIAGGTVLFPPACTESFGKQLGTEDFRVPLGIKSLSKAAWVAKLLYPYACNIIRHIKGVAVDRAYIMELIKARIQEILAVHEEGVVENARTASRGNPGELLWTYDQTIMHLQQCLAVNDTKTLASYFASQMEITSEDENVVPQIKGIDVPADRR